MYYKHRVSVVAGGEWNHSWVLWFINLPCMKIQNYIFQYFPVKNEKKSLPGWSSERLTMSPALTSKLLLRPAAEIQLPSHTFTYNTLSTGFACMYFFFMYINFTADELIRSQFICGMMTLQSTWNMVRRTHATS